MRINPSEIRVDYGNGQLVTLGNDANWERVREYIDRLFQWDKSYPGDPVVPQEQAVTEPTAAGTSATEAVIAFADVTDPAIRIIDRIIIALGKSGGALTVKETYRQMLVDGYVNVAAKPENNVHSRVRKYPSLIKMSEGKVKLLPAGWEHFNRLEAVRFQGLSDKNVAVPSRYKDDVAKTDSDILQVSQKRSPLLANGTDFLLLALHKLGGSAALRDLIDPMIEYGWRPNSETPQKKLHNVSALVSTSQEYVDRERGQATINLKGLERLKHRVNEGVITMDKPNSPAPDSKESNTGLFVQT